MALYCWSCQLSYATVDTFGPHICFLGPDYPRCMAMLDPPRVEGGAWTRQCPTVCTGDDRYCDRHLRESYFVEVRPSHIKGAGRGLFAVHPRGQDYPAEDDRYLRALDPEPRFRKGMVICLYGGEVITHQGVDRRSNQDYIAEGSNRPDTFVDAYRLRGAGAMANDNLLNPGANNAKLAAHALIGSDYWPYCVVHGTYTLNGRPMAKNKLDQIKRLAINETKVSGEFAVILEATKDIFVDQEITIAYGDAYWLNQHNFSNTAS